MADPQKAQSPAATGQSAQDSKTDPSIVEQIAAESKQFATIRAKAARHGIAVYRTLEDRGASWRYLGTRWGWCREFDDLAGLVAWLALQGVRE